MPLELASAETKRSGKAHDRAHLPCHLDSHIHSVRDSRWSLLEGRVVRAAHEQILDQASALALYATSLWVI